MPLLVSHSEPVLGGLFVTFDFETWPCTGPHTRVEAVNAQVPGGTNGDISMWVSALSWAPDGSVPFLMTWWPPESVDGALDSHSGRGQAGLCLPHPQGVLGLDSQG